MKSIKQIKFRGDAKLRWKRNRAVFENCSVLLSFTFFMKRKLTDRSFSDKIKLRFYKMVRVDGNKGKWRVSYETKK